MKKHTLPPLLFPLLAASLFSCGEQQASKVALQFGSLIGNREEDAISGTSQLTFVKKSGLKRLLDEKENFLLLVHGSSDTCTCFTNWHDKVLSPFVKKEKLLLRAITLDDFEVDTETYGISTREGADTLAIIKEGQLAFQHDTRDEADPWVNTYAEFSAWMYQRIELPKIFYVNEEILDSFYEGDEDFTVYFGRDTCGDCSYLNRTALRDYLFSHEHLEENFLYINFDVFRGTEVYQEKKDKYGLSWSEENPAGYSTGVFPTVYYVHPDGESYQGDVIEAAGVYYNESIKDGLISGSYFTSERLSNASRSYLTYLSDANYAPKVLEGIQVDPEAKDRHEALKPYTEPLFNLLLDYAVKI